MEEDVKKVTLKFSMFNFLLKISGSLAVLASMFGVGFQKGIISATQLGNINGSYDVREIFNSAIMGSLYYYNKLDMKEIIARSKELFWVNLLQTFIIVLVTILVIFFIKNAKNKGKIPVVELNTESIPKWFLLLVVPIISSILSAAIIFLSPILVAIILATALFICGFGYIVGEAWLINSINTKLCNATSESSKQETLHQCTQLYFNGKRLKGDIILENSDGYIIRRNDSFLFYSKDGSRCFYSKFLSTEPKTLEADINESVFSSVDPEIVAFCSNKSG